MGKLLGMSKIQIKSISFQVFPSQPTLSKMVWDESRRSTRGDVFKTVNVLHTRHDFFNDLSVETTCFLLGSFFNSECWLFSFHFFFRTNLTKIPVGLFDLKASLSESRLRELKYRCQAGQIEITLRYMWAI